MDKIFSIVEEVSIMFYIFFKKFTVDNASSADQQEDEEIYVVLCGVADTTASKFLGILVLDFRYCNVVVKTAGKITKKNFGTISFSFEQQAPKPIMK